MTSTEPKILDLPYRVFRRVERELRMRASGVDLVFDRKLGEAATRRVDSRRLFEEFLPLAPWGDGGFPVAEIEARERVAVMAAADRALGHEFDLLGSGPVQLGRVIDWHRDFKSGFRWDPATHFTRVRQTAPPLGADIKVPWELSRCLHFSALGLADALTGEAKYYAGFKEQLRGWLDANPYGRGVNWACAMDVGIRAVNWLNAVQLFGHRIRADEDKEFFHELRRSLWLHGWYVRRHLEWSGPRGGLGGNHLLADLTGLLGIGLLLRAIPSGQRWFRFARYHLAREMIRQVRADGCNHENSTSYHRLVMEMFEWSAALAARAGEPFPAAYGERLGRMRKFVAAYTAPSGAAAQFGDNDSGRLLAGGIGEACDHRYLTDGECGFGGRIDRLLIRGRVDSSDGGVAADPQRGFPEGGFYFASRGPAWLGVRAGAYEEGGGHSHCDQLSFVLNVAGRDLLVDRGTGIYTPDPERRNRYRSTASHNVFSVNGWEQNPIGSARSSIFRLPDHARTTVIEWDATGNEARFAGEHRGFEARRAGMRCRRDLVLGAEQLAVTDRVPGLAGGDQIEWAFHFAPGVGIELKEDGALLRRPPVIVEMTWPAGLAARIDPTPHSPAYGVEVPALRLCLAVVVSAPVPEAFEFVFRWDPKQSS